MVKEGDAPDGAVTTTLVQAVETPLTTKDAHLGKDDENKERGNWASKMDYLLSIIGYAVGLGNIWRFPYLAYKNGGGAFLIPYFLMLFLTGLPLFFLESALGQFSSQGPINVWKAVPLLQGVGVAMVVIISITSLYYNAILAYSLFYLFASFQEPLPWALRSVNCTDSDAELGNISELMNTSCPSSEQTPSELYWDDVALRRSSGIEETGTVVWHLALCLMLSSIIVGAALFKGIKTSGKVVYFTATFPYVVILILLIRGVTLEGATDGIAYYIGSQSNLTKLTDVQVWRDGATQTFFTLSIGFGVIPTLASYNNFHNNVFKDAFIVCFANAGTSVFAGVAIFSILGHMALVYNKPVAEVVNEGFGLVFIVYPDALSKLPISPLWSVLFFFMILTVGLDSQFGHIEVIITCLVDAFPSHFKSKRSLLTVTISGSVFLLGLLCATQAGIYWVTLLDQFIGTWVLLIVGLSESVGIFYIYGGNRFIKDIEMMIGKKSFGFWLWWRICWFFISPCIICVILIWSLVTFTPPSYGSVPYPNWAVALGWCLVAFVFVWIPLIAFYKILKTPGTPRERVQTLCRPSDEWRPYLQQHRGLRYKQDGNSSSVISSSWL